ncbi:MAG: bifunctional phosphoglucose/phosphomannose isomerase [Methanomassiliicoccales archaeon]|nr:bifunctional phosphoglucose/phosphomannose isomerase [Methanomassiliicoccales archaeon]
MSGPLDDVAGIATLDKSGMLRQMLSMPMNLEEMLQRPAGVEGRAEEVCVVGMGGSAIGADVLLDYCAEVSEVPMAVVRGLSLPRWVDRDTLVLLVSYSGNTWEVLELFEEAMRRGCSTFGITSGGRLLELCEMQGVPNMKVPSGLQPRAAIGYLMGAAAVVLDEADVAPVRRDLAKSVPAVADLMQNLSPGVPTDSNMAKKTATKLKGKVPVIYAPSPIRSVARRWMTQINENSKMLAFSGEYPEMNHNQIVGWVEGERCRELQPVFLRANVPNRKVNERAEVTFQLIREGKLEPLQVELSGRSVLETALMGIALGDMVSFYLAVLKGVDPSPVASIAELKKSFH